MSKPKPYPEDDALVIRKAARYLDTALSLSGIAVGIETLPIGGAPGAAAVAKATWAANTDDFLNGVKKLLGDYTVAHDLALGWATLANTPTDIRDELIDQMKGQVDDYWKGTAFESFSSHMDSINEKLKDTSAKLNVMAKTLSNAITLVFDTWGSAVGYISKCAITVAGVWDPGAIADAIKKMANDTADLVEKSIKTLGHYKGDQTKLEIDEIDFPVLKENPKMLASAGNADGWDVRHA